MTPRKQCLSDTRQLNVNSHRLFCLSKTHICSNQTKLTREGKSRQSPCPNQEAVYNWYLLGNNKSVCLLWCVTKYINCTPGYDLCPGVDAPNKIDSMSLYFSCIFFVVLVLFVFFLCFWFVCFDFQCLISFFFFREWTWHLLVGKEDL